jgi:glutamate synthase domain-containing protein 1/glutamate synthase domain-containing protein 3
MSHLTKRIIESRKDLLYPNISRKQEEEGGCGVVGFAASVPVRGRHIFEPSIQMHNRGNGKGGGIAAACLDHKQLGVDEATLRDDYILQIALTDPDAESEVEETAIIPQLNIDHKTKIKPTGYYQDLGLEIKPPDVVRYFVRAKKDVLAKFAEEKNLKDAGERVIEDEFVYRNSTELNQRFYASLGDKRAFVLSHARNLFLFKIVGYAEQVVQYYGLEDLEAQVWIAHQRYPTKGRVWHPAGSHPFIGMNEALVHNGDFANYYSVSEYLCQHNIFPQFLTDTEVSVLLFDLLHRVYGYPLEYVIEAMAPTTELDFNNLPEDKQRIYRQIQALHMHGSPDGPWFFIIARSEPDTNQFRLLGITDTSMLRPQVFAIQEGEVSIGLVASEKQAIDATLHSLSEEDSRFRLVADRYWNARGGSSTDGGAFVFTIKKSNGASTLTCTDKFGKIVEGSPGELTVNLGVEPCVPKEAATISEKMDKSRPEELFGKLSGYIASWDFSNVSWLLREIEQLADRGDDGRECAIELLGLLNDRDYDCGEKKRSMIIQLIRGTIDRILDSVPIIDGKAKSRFCRVNWESRGTIRPPRAGEVALVISARGFPPEGDDCDAQLAVKAHNLGWKRFIVYGIKGQRFHGCGFGPDTSGVRLDLFGSSGDYLGSGIDGMEIHMHGNGQDQLGQILKQGKLIVHGDVGQAFMYGAKGGEVYIKGNAAGRPLINAAGRPRVVINGTCLDYLAESFMAGDPHNGGGFVVINGIEFDDKGRVVEQRTPYPGSNLFSLASGGAIFIRDPHKRIVEEQLNGGEFADMKDTDWSLILPYLQANEKYFGISIEDDILSVNGERRSPLEVYRKVRAIKLAVLAKVKTDVRQIKNREETILIHPRR